MEELSNIAVTKLSLFSIIYLYKYVFLAHTFIKMKNGAELMFSLNYSSNKQSSSTDDTSWLENPRLS